MVPRLQVPPWLTLNTILTVLTLLFLFVLKNPEVAFYTFAHSNRRPIGSASLNVLSNCHFDTDENPFISEKSPIGDFRLYNRRFKSAKI